MKTAVVILNWNGKKFLEEFLPGLVASLEGYDAEVVVADNASTDGSQDYLKEAFPGLKLVQFDNNYGFTGGYNRAFEALYNEGADDPKYFLLINSDIEVTENWLYPLEEWMDLHEECAACGPKLHSWQERDSFEYAGAAGGFLDCFGYPFCKGRVMKRVEMDNGQYDSPSDVLWATGACLMVRSSIWKELGGLDDRFFAHMEEIDFCWRARLAGYRINTVPRSLVYHVGGGTLPQDSPFKLHLNFRNNLLMLSNNLGKALTLKNFFDVVSTTAPEMAICTDEFRNCMEVFNDLPEKMQVSILETSAAEAVKMAARRIRIRWFLDWCSELVYTLKGNRDYAKAVRAAHKEYKKLATRPDKKELYAYLVNDINEDNLRARRVLDIDLDRRKSERIRFKGIIDESIVLLSAAYKDEVFDYLKDII